METITTLERLNELKQTQEGLLILFGGLNCNTCHAIKPKLIELMDENYPKIKMIYLDCHENPELGSQNGVLSLPTLQVFFGGQRFIEEVRTFSLHKVIQDLARPYKMCFDEA